MRISLLSNVIVESTPATADSQAGAAHRSLGRLVFVALMLSVAARTADGQSMAAGQVDRHVDVLNVRKVFDDGQHNAFTDLVSYHGSYWLTFRTCPDGHMVHPTSEIVVLRSDDLDTWTESTRFSVALRDVRDPHFAVLGERLFVYTGTWYCGAKSPEVSEYDLNRHLGYAIYTSDGDSWSQPKMLEGTYGHYIWRAAAYGGRMYLCGRRKQGFDARNREDSVVESAMLVSDDGLRFSTAGLYQETSGDETAFLFEPDGKVIGVSRRGRGNAQLVESSPPYQDWRRRGLTEYIGGPFLARWAGGLVTGGRCNTENGPKTKLMWLEEDQLTEFAELPSGGDNSYPGFIALSDTEAVVSWYSSHEVGESGHPNTSIYLARLRLHGQPIRQEFEVVSSVDDSRQPVYLTVPPAAKSMDLAPVQEEVPLVVSLHSWSATLEQRHDDLQRRAYDRGWYFLQPNFRGINQTPEACGSRLAQQDILDAVDWALANYPIDSSRIYLTGNSGGGHMTMLMAARYPERWTAASAWVGISDLTAWHEMHAGGKYGEMLRKCVGGRPGESERINRELHDRSPIHFLRQVGKLPLDISAGIHDGHTGSVPIDHSLNAFNAVAQGLGEQMISADEIKQLLRKGGRLQAPLPGDELYDPIFGRQIYLRRKAGNSRVTIFEGGHEGIARATMSWFGEHP